MADAKGQGALAGTGALVTGGGSGIGLGCAKRLAADGAAVTICGRTPDKLEAAAKEIRAVAAAGAEVRTVAADVTDEADVERAVAAACDGAVLRAVVASAGGSSTVGPITQVDATAFRNTLELNVVGTFLTLKHTARAMVANGGGSFVAVSSIASSNTHRWFGAYGPAKAGIEKLCEMAADELGASGVRVNVIRPGLVDTELVAGVLASDEVLNDYLECMPLGRVGTPDDVANLARFLVGPESSWITGQTVNCDGGHSLRRGPDFRAFFEPLFGADGLRGVVT